MYFRTFAKIILLSTVFALEASAGPSSRTADNIPTTGPFVPTAANIISNTTVPLGEAAVFGWVYDSVPNVPESSPVFDGFAKNISAWFTPPGGKELLIFTNIVVGPFSSDFCGIYSGSSVVGFLPSQVLGTYEFILV
ncbi:hypothetical protein C8R45DRAFT_990393, partial [Mycena sanguinolenta]